MDRHFVDSAFTLGIVGALLGYMPAISSVFAIAWFVMQMYYKYKSEQDKKNRVGKRERQSDRED